MASGDDIVDDDDGGEAIVPSEGLRRRVLALVDPASPFEGFVERMTRLFDLPESRTREILASTRAPAEDPWRSPLGPGIRLLDFEGGPAVASADCGLVRLAAGAKMVRHRHRGIEILFALAGTAEEEGGEIWQPGDVVIREAGSAHDFRSIGDEPFLFAVALYGGFEATGG